MGSRVVRQPGTSLAPGRLEDLPEPTWRSMLERGLPQFAGEAVAPVLVFYAAWKLWGLAPAIAASTVVYLALAAWVLRRGHDLTLIAVGAAFVVIQALVGLASHSPTVYLAQPVVLSALWGVGDKKRGRAALEKALASFRELGDQAKVEVLETRMRTMR